jgi:hypothetical protein
LETHKEEDLEITLWKIGQEATLVSLNN